MASSAHSIATLIFEDWWGFFKTHRRIDLDESSGIAYSTTQCPTGDFPW